MAAASTTLETTNETTGSPPRYVRFSDMFKHCVQNGFLKS